MDPVDSERLDQVIRSNIETLCRHFFPAGRKDCGEWKIGDITGAHGDSLGIQLTGANAGLWHDRATGDGGKFAKLLMLNRSVTFRDAVELIERALGISLSATQENSSTTKPFGNVRWNQCTLRMTPDKRAELCTYRGYSPAFVDWLVDQRLIGIFRDKHGIDQWAFPVHYEGKVAAIHCEVPGDDRKVWFYWPKLAELGLKLVPFVLGDLTTASEVHIHESQWDLLAEADVLCFDQENQGIALVATLGSSNGALAGVVNSLNCQIYLWPQRDVANQKGKIPSQEWLFGVRAVFKRPARVCWIPNLEPKQNFDFNDWRRRGDLSADKVAEIMRSAEPLDPPGQDQSRNGTPTPTEEKPLRPMLSWIDYAQMEIDTTQYLIGDGFLEPGGYVVLIGSSYAGKSTLCTQMSISFAIGKHLFGCNVRRELRSIIVQAEDSRNKLIRMGKMSQRMGLTKNEVELVRKNTAILTIRDKQDLEAILEIERHALVFKPDIIWLNPLTSFLSLGVYKDEAINKFLRTQWTPMLDRLGCGGFVIHHPPKPAGAGKDCGQQTAYELQYNVAGMAAITNNTRGNLFLLHVEEEVFKLVAGKGFEEVDLSGGEVFIRRSLDEEKRMLWEECTIEQAEEACEKREERREKNKPGPKGNEKDDIDKILTVIYSRDEEGGLSFDELQRFTGIKRTTIQRRLAKLVEEGRRLYLSVDGCYQLKPAYRRERDKEAGVETKPEKLKADMEIV